MYGTTASAEIGLMECLLPQYVPARFWFCLIRPRGFLDLSATDPDGTQQVLISLLYNPFVLFLLLRHRCGRLYHPGWDVGFDLIIWALRYVLSDCHFPLLDRPLDL